VARWRKQPEEAGRSPAARRVGYLAVPVPRRSRRVIAVAFDRARMGSNGCGTRHGDIKLLAFVINSLCKPLQSTGAQ
jgi:hypothetical protein